MNSEIKDFRTLPSGFVLEESGTTHTFSSSGELVFNLTSAGYGRVTKRDINLVNGSEYWMLVDMFIPVGYFPNSVWSFRPITIDNWNQDTTPTRLAIHVKKDGNLAIVSNRGDTYKPLVESAIKAPAGRKFQLVFHVKMGSVDGKALAEVYLDGVLVITTTKANIDGNDVFQRARIGADGAAGARNKIIIISRGVWGTTSPLVDQRAILEAQLAEAQKQVDLRYADYLAALAVRDLIQEQLDNL